MPYFLAPLGNAQSFDSAGNPLVGGSWKTFLAGTTTPATTFTSQAGTVQQGTTMTLDAMGLPVNGPVWMLGAQALKFRLSNASGVQLDEWDNISGIGDTNATPDEWVLFPAAPTYVSATVFTLAGDQTNIFQVKRRLKSTNTGGTVYSTIVSAIYTTVTTVTVTNTSGVLDAGLSAVSYGLLAANNTSVPAIIAASGANNDITSLGGLTTGLAAAGVRGLLGVPNTATPLTKFDLSADRIVMANATGNTFVENTIATSTVDFGLAGSIVNGRDQAAVFAVSSWVHIHRIYNGTTKGWLASLSATAPTLPSGYTYSAYATSVRWNGSSNIVPCSARGAAVTFSVEVAALASGASTTEATVSLAAYMPPNALCLGVDIFLNNASTASFSILRLTSGSTFVTTYASTNSYMHNHALIPNLGQSVIYAVGAASCPMSIYPQYYRIANGDA